MSESPMQGNGQRRSPSLWVERRGKDARGRSLGWRVRERLPDGRKVWASKTYRTEREARTESDRLKAERAVGIRPAPERRNTTFGELAAKYLARPDIAESTRKSRESYLSVHVLPRWGDARAADITRGDVQKLLAALTARGVGAQTVHATARVLSSILAQAVRDEVIPRNPAAGMGRELPRITERHVEPPDEATLLEIADAITPRHRRLVMVLGFAGLRFGEAAALRVSDFDPLHARLHVHRSLTEVRGKLIEGPTKSKKARTISLPRFLVQELAKHLAEFGTPADAPSHIFTIKDGSPIMGANFRLRIWRPACVVVGLDPAPHVHDLRHTTASIWIAANANPKVVAELLGHSSIAITMDRYGHLFENTQREMATVIDQHYRAEARER